jgi:hypothetical protein
MYSTTCFALKEPFSGRQILEYRYVQRVGLKTVYKLTVRISRLIQKGSSMFWGVTISSIVRKISYWHVYNCERLPGYSCSSLLNYDRFLFVGLDEERSLQKKFGYSRRIAGSHFRCCWKHKEGRTSTETNNTPSWHTSCKVGWGWQWDFVTFIVNCNRSAIL